MRIAMRPAARYLRDAAVFAPCYVALDWASYIDPVGPFNITPWNPQPALAIVWMLLGGLHHAPAVLATIFAADLTVRGAPGGVGISLAGALILASGYAAIAAALRALLHADATLRSTRQLTQFAAWVVAGSAAVGLVFVGVLHGAGLLAMDGFARPWLQFWIGDAVGTLVTAPLLLAAADAARRRALVELARRPELLLQVVVLVAALWLVFSDALGNDPSRHFYLLFAPLIWIAARAGFSGAVAAAAIVQLGVVLGMQTERGATVPAVEFQALVAAFTLTGLYLGMMVEERERAAEGLRQTLRLAAAGEMAGAIAHEVNQPLTALTNYGRAARQLIDGAGGADSRLPEVIAKMIGEADRASDVVRRLRDLFREGTTRLEPARIDDLLDAATRIGMQLVGPRPITIATSAEPGLAALYVDRLQIEMVLRNLIANAVEAIGDKSGRIVIEAKHRGEGQVRFVIADSGPGVPEAAGPRLFEPFRSGKPTGMGLGLAISRAIAEAHGGTLDSAGKVHGEFHLTLPCVAEED